MNTRVLLILMCVVFITGCGVEYQFKKAEQLKENGKYHEAIVKYRDITKKYSTSEVSSTAQFTIANIYLYKINNYEQAKIEYRLFINNNPKDNRVNKANNEMRKIYKILNLLSEAQSDLQNQNIKKAIKGFENVLKLDPDSPEGKQGLHQAEKKKVMKKHWDFGMDYYNKKEYEKAISEFQKVLKLDPDYQLHSQSKRLIEQAKEQIQIKHDKEQIEEYYQKGLDAMNDENYDEALKFLKKAEKINPNYKELKKCLTNIDEIKTAKHMEWIQLTLRVRPIAEKLIQKYYDIYDWELAVRAPKVRKNIATTLYSSDVYLELLKKYGEKYAKKWEKDVVVKIIEEVIYEKATTNPFEDVWQGLNP